MSPAPPDFQTIPEPPWADVAILVPVYRNMDTVAELAARIAGALSAVRPDFKIVFVVDASPDDSWGVIRQLAKDDVRICGILLRRNQGQHNALMLGLRQVRARWVAVMDADLQDPPELLPKMIDECARTSQTVYALRDGPYQSWARMLASRIFKRLLGRVIDLPANAGCYFVVPEPVAGKMRCAGVRQAQLVVMARFFSPGWSAVSFARGVRIKGKSAYSLWGLFRYALRSLACVWECRYGIKQSTPIENSREINSLIMDRVNI